MSEAVYLSPVKGRLVPRFSTLGGPGGRTYIGAQRTADGLVVNEDAVAQIPAVEFGRYRKEYTRAIADGSLKKRTREDFEAWRKARLAALAASQKPDPEPEADEPMKSDVPPAGTSIIEPVEGGEPEPNGADE
jgi:hypothetical protein